MTRPSLCCASPRFQFSLLMIAVAFLAIGMPVSTVCAQLRIVTYNIAQLNGDTSAVEDVLMHLMDDDVSGFAVAPAAIVFQEVQNADLSPLVSFANNVAPVGVTYAAATYTNDGEDGTAGAIACIYRTDMLDEVPGLHIDLFTGGGRRTDRWRFELDGYDNPDAAFWIYGSHLKAGDSSSDQAQRLSGASLIRNNADALGPGEHIIFCGDYNFSGHTDDAYERFFDAGNARANDEFGTGSWSGSGNAIKHSQSPRLNGGNLVGGGMDDRFDMLLTSDAFNDPNGLTIMSGTYRSVGNDGSHFDTSINSGNNFYFPGDIPRSNQLADDLFDASDHIPVMVSFRLPGLLAAAADEPDFGRVITGATVLATADLWNAAPAVTPAGAEAIPFMYSGTGDVIASGSGFLLPLGSPTMTFGVVPTETEGARSGSIVYTSSAEGVSDRSVDITGIVVRPSAASFAPASIVTDTTIKASSEPDQGALSIPINLFNVGFDALQARLDVDEVGGIGTGFAIDGDLPADVESSVTILATFETDGQSPGMYETLLSFEISDEDIPGEGNGVLTALLQVTISGSTIPADLNMDGSVDFADLVILLASWGDCPDAPAECIADLDGDESVGFGDLLQLLAAWS